MVSITSRDSQSLDRYLNDINKYALLSVEQETEMAKRAREGDVEAIDLMVRSNLRFVVSVAKQYQHRGMDLIDVINEGNLGLIKAAQKFDETKGFRFISFAVWWIRQNIMQAIASQSRTVRLPLNQVSAITTLNKKIATLEQKMERTATTEEIAENTNLGEDKVKEQLTNARLSVSLHAIRDEEVGSTLLDVLQDTNFEADKGVMEESFQSSISDILDLLPPRERYIISLNYGLENNDPVLLEDIAVILKIGKERVRQLRDIAIKKLIAHRDLIKNKIMNED